MLLFIPCRPGSLLPMLCCGQEKVPLGHLVEPEENLLPNSETQLVWELYYLCDSTEQWGTGKLTQSCEDIGHWVARLHSDMGLWIWGDQAEGGSLLLVSLKGNLRQQLLESCSQLGSPKPKTLYLWGNMIQINTLKWLLESLPEPYAYPSFLENF